MTHPMPPDRAGRSAHDDLVARFETRLRGTRAAIDAVEQALPDVAAIADLLRSVFDAGGLLATAGNGGSAAEALHLAEELIGRYRADRPPRRAVCLNADPTALTCIANDYGFEHIFSRQCEALLRPDDALVVLSTSGRSPNLVRAAEAAQRIGARVVGLLGRDGGPCRVQCDRAVVIPLEDSAHIQEAHQVVMHLWCEALEPDSGGSP